MKDNLPTTLLEASRYFGDQDSALGFLVGMRWPHGVCCPRCNSKKVSFTAKRRVWTCEECPKRRQFSVKVGTIMEDSPIALDKWLIGIWLIVSAKNGISSYELHRTLGVTQKTAWFMLHRIRLAMQSGTIEKMKGEVEADETFIGAKARNMHAGKRKVKGTGVIGKTAVMGLLQRDERKGHSRVAVKVIPNRKTAMIHSSVCEAVEPGSTVYTDALSSYRNLSEEYVHGVIDHAVKYVDGKIHTNGLENFWSLLKRAIRGTYVNVEPFHLFRYLDEQAFRFNERKGTDLTRFMTAIPSIVGRRLTYANLTGNVEPA